MKKVLGIEPQITGFRSQLCTVCTLQPGDVNMCTPPPSTRQGTRSKNSHIQPRDTITRFLLINYQKKKKKRHQLLTMSSHFLWKQLETGFLMFVSYIYHTEIGRGEQITFFYCIEKRSALYLRPAESSHFVRFTKQTKATQPASLFQFSKLSFNQSHTIHFLFYKHRVFYVTFTGIILTIQLIFTSVKQNYV